MPRQSKSKTDASAPVVNTPVLNAEETSNVSAVKTEKPKKESKPKETSMPKVDATTVVSSATAPTHDSTGVSVAPETTEDVSDLATRSTEFIAKLNQLGSLFASLKAEFRSMEKSWSRELKTAQKSQAKRKRKSGNRQPSGFVKPTKISDELAKFLEKPVGTEMARTDVTREINTYIRAHKLQDASNGRKIIPDAKLASLLKLKKTDELTYFNLQKYMSPHFSKAEKPVAAATA